MTEYKINSIADFNSFLDNEYKDLNPCKENWYPIMYYDETIDLRKKIHDGGDKPIFNSES